MTNTVITDHRSGGDKTFGSEQRFKRRQQKLIADAVQEDFRKGKITIKDGFKTGEISIQRDGLDQPYIIRGQRSKYHRVLTGNREFVDGDILPRPEGGTGQGGSGDQAGSGGQQEDLFRFTLTREEFIKIFLKDLELPRLVRKQLARMEQVGMHRSGYAKTGSPASLSIKRTLLVSKMRRIALKRPKQLELDDLEKEIESATGDKYVQLTRELKRLKKRRKDVPFLADTDLRYRSLVPLFKPTVNAVMFCLMDVSGSMSQGMKDLAKRFFMLLEIFLMSRYKRVDMVFIRHTDKAEEVDEHTFFYSQETGGTLVSSAFVEMQRIIKKRYPPNEWCIYGAQASDGDNLSSDNQKLAKLLVEILPLVQYFAYLEVSSGNGTTKSLSDIWPLYQSLSKDGRLINMKKAHKPSQIYPVFRELFQPGQTDGQTKEGVAA